MATLKGAAIFFNIHAYFTPYLGISFLDRTCFKPTRLSLVAKVSAADKATSGLRESCTTAAAPSVFEAKVTRKEQHHRFACGAAENTIAANAGAAVACCRRALLMRMAYGGLNFDQTLLKGSVWSWGERCGHVPMTPNTPGESSVAGSKIASDRHTPSSPPAPPAIPTTLRGGNADGVTPFVYMHRSATTAHKGNAWMAFVLVSYTGCGMPELLRTQLLAHMVGASVLAITGDRSHSASKTRGQVAPPMQSPGSVQDTGSSHGDDSVAGTVTAAGDRRLLMRRSSIGSIVRETDAILSGVDFHCSNVLEEVLRSAALRGKVAQALRRARGDHGNGSEVVTTTNGVGDDGFSDHRIERAAKQAMWTCSSGLNARKLQLRFVWDNRAGQLHQANSVLVRVEGDVTPTSCVDATVWAALSSDVAAWARRFVRGKLTSGALGRGPPLS